jgi:hypothetical protein
MLIERFRSLYKFFRVCRLSGILKLYPLTILLSLFTYYSYGKIEKKIKVPTGLFTNTWNLGNLRFIYYHVSKNFDHSNIKVLEIGCWEGFTTKFFLENFSECDVTCVDTFGGSDEHKGIDGEQLQQRFKGNVLDFSNRVKIEAMTSAEYFYRLRSDSQLFDIVYIDGSHFAFDVVNDIVNGFRLTKLGGMVILDDFTWTEYANTSENPHTAIGFALKVIASHAHIIRISNQIFLKKLSEFDFKMLRSGD